MAEKKGFLHQLIVGKDKAEGFARASLPSNRWELFWDVLKGRFWKLVFLNLMMLVGLIPVIVLVFFNTTSSAAVGTALPYSAHLGIGYAPYPGVVQAGMAYSIGLSNSMFILMIPACVFAGIVFSGVFYIMRNLVWGEGVFIAPDFWKGLKDNIVHFMLIGLLEALVLWVTVYTSGLARLASAMGEGNFWMSMSTVSSMLVAVLFSMMCLYMMTLTVTYKLKFFQLLKNAFLLSLGMIFQNVFFAVLCFAPLILMFIIPSLASFLLMLYLMIGFSGAALGWTTYSHYVFDRFINDRVDGAAKNRGMYEKVNLQGQPVTKRVKSSRLVKRRPLKPVTDEDVVLTELPAAFTRADLQRLADEKERMREDAELWSIEHEDDPEIVGDMTIYEDEEPLDEYEESSAPEEQEEQQEEQQEEGETVKPSGKKKSKKK